MKINLPPSEPPNLEHVDENGRIKHTPPFDPGNREPLPIDNIDKDGVTRLPNTQKQFIALRNIYERVRTANSEEELQSLRELQDHIPARERAAYTKKLDNIKQGMDNRRKLKRLLQIKGLRSMARRNL